MALMVMGIGVVSVVTLFPVSLLRCIEATKLTNATLLKQNAESRLNASVSYDLIAPIAPGRSIPRGVLRDPDHDGNIREHEGERFIIDPLGGLILVNDGITSFLPPVEPDEWTNATIFGDINGDGVYALGQDSFYSFDRDRDGTFDPIKRYTFGVGGAQGGTVTPAAIEAAENFVTLPDSFITIFEGVHGTTCTVSNASTIVVNDGTLGDFAGTIVRATVFNSGVRTSAITNGTVATDGQTVNLMSSLPPSVTAAPDRIILDMPERRYTWIATVRNTGTSPSVSIATFFRRSFAPQDEKAFTLTEPAGSFNVFEMNWAANGITKNTVTGTFTGMPPGFERGGWMFDLGAFRWWEIVDFQEIDQDGNDVNDAFRFATDPEEYDPRIQPRSPVYAIFPQNIIEVYTLDKD